MIKNNLYMVLFIIIMIIIMIITIIWLNNRRYDQFNIGGRNTSDRQNALDYLEQNKKKITNILNKHNINYKELEQKIKNDTYPAGVEKIGESIINLFEHIKIVEDNGFRVGAPGGREFWVMAIIIGIIYFFIYNYIRRNNPSNQHPHQQTFIVIYQIFSNFDD